MTEAFIHNFQNHVLNLVDTMVGCACDLNVHNYETLIKTREEVIDYITIELSKSTPDNF